MSKKLTFISECPWPRKGDKLITTDGGLSNACLNYTHDPWILYAEGYRKAADCLAQQVINREGYPDFLVYPIVFSYRQYIELELKWFIKRGSALLRKEEPKLKEPHNLLLLWTAFRNIIEELFPEEGTDDLEAVEEIIEQLAALDKKSTAFRYPVEFDGSPTLPDIRHINVANLHEVMSKIGGFFDGAGGAICELSQSY